MVASRMTVPSNVQPYELQNEELLGIARLVRATSVIEYIISLYLCKLADISEGQSTILLGKMQPSGRLRLAETFAKTKGPGFVALHKELFDDERYQAMIVCRNTAVHGFLLGKADTGTIAFAVQEPAGTDENKIFTTVRAYIPEAFAQAADFGEELIPRLLDRLGLRSSLEIRRAQVLAPHPKAHPQTAKKKAKPPTPRRA